MNRFIIFIFILGATSFFGFSAEARSAWAAGHTPWPGYTVLYSNDEVSILTSDDHQKTITVLEINNAHQPVSSAQPPGSSYSPVPSQLSSEMFAKRVASAAEFGLIEQREVSQFSADGYRVFTVASKWRSSESVDLEAWIAINHKTLVIVGSYPDMVTAQREKQNFRKILKSLKESRAPASAEPQEIKTEAQAQCLTCDVSLFEGPVRNVLSEIKSNLESQCTKGAAKPYSAGEVAYKIGAGCLKGGVESIRSLVAFVYELANFLIKTNLNSKYQSELMGNLGHIVGEVVRHPISFLTQVYGAVLGALQKQISNFRSCGVEYQVNLTCNVLSNLISGGVLAKMTKLGAVKEAAQVATTVDAVASAVDASPAVNQVKDALATVHPVEVKSSLTVKSSTIEVKTGADTSNVSKTVERHLADLQSGSADQIAARTGRRLDREDEVFDLLNQMRKLKEKETTSASLNELRELNGRALDLVGQELKENQIAFKIVDPAKGEGNELSKSYLIKSEKPMDQESLKSIKAVREKLQEMFDSAETESERAIYFRALREHDEKIARLEAQLAGDVDGAARPPIASASDLKAQHSWTNPYIVILPSPSNPKYINRIMQKFGAELVYSPNWKSVNPTSIAAVLHTNKPVLMMPIEQLFTADPLLNSSTMHEVRHLSFAQARRRGIETPYNIRLTAAPGEKLHSVEGVHYDTYMSLEELSTWNRDLNYFSSRRLGGQRERGFDFENNVRFSADTQRMRLSTARSLETLSQSAIDALTSAREFLQVHGHTLRVAVRRGARSEYFIDVPYYRNGHRVGDVEITLVNYDPTKPGNAIEMALEYLDRAEAQALNHQENARKILAQKP